MMSWTDIIIEGYCVASKDDPIPIYCKERKKPRFMCLSEECPYFGYCDAEESLYLHINKYYKDKD